MFKIDRAILEQLGFDFDAALKKFAEEKERHPFTVDVPAPTAHGLVEAAFQAGGYEVVEPEITPLPEAPVPLELIQPNPRKLAALDRIQNLKGKSVDSQLGEIRSLMTDILEMLPG